MQYRTLRQNVLLLILLMTAVVGANRAYSFVLRRYVPAASLTQRLGCVAICGLTFLLYMHGTSVVFILAIVSINYWIAKTYEGHPLNPALTWSLSVVVLFANFHYEGYRFADMSSSLASFVRGPVPCESISKLPF